MNEMLKKFLDDQKKAEREKYEETKQQTLIDLDLYEIVYSPDNKYNDEYPEQEWETKKYYKKVPIDITDEEYQEVKKYLEKETNVKSHSVAMALNVIAWIIYIVGFLAGISAIESSFTLAFIYWFVSFISGTMFLGFAEIIRLLNTIKNK